METIKYYEYSNNPDENNLFIRTIEIDNNLTEMDKVGLIPSNSTTIALPADTLEEGKVYCFIDENWVVKDDYRGKKIHNLSTREEMDANTIGFLPAGFVIGELPKIEKTLEEVKTQKAYEIEETTQKALAYGVVINVGGKNRRFRCLSEVKSALETLLILNTDESEPFENYNPDSLYDLYTGKTTQLENDWYSDIMFSYAELKNVIYPKMKERVTVLKNWKYNTLRGLELTSTIEEVNNINMDIN